jgi:hypothetical protein
MSAVIEPLNIGTFLIRIDPSAGPCSPPRFAGI